MAIIILYVKNKNSRFNKHNSVTYIILFLYIIYNITRSVFGITNPLSNHYILILIPSATIFFTVSNLKLNSKEINYLSLSFIGSFLISVIPGILLQAKYRPAFERLTLSWTNANYFASFLLVIIPFIIYKIFTQKKRKKYKIFYYILLFIAFISLIWSQSRGAILAVVLVSFVFLISYFVKKHKKKAIIATVIVFIVLVGILLIGLTQYRFATIQFRQRVYKSSLEYVQKHWLLGTGPDTFSTFYPKYRNPDYRLLHQEDIIPHAHNEFLEQFAELGIFGLLLFLGFIFMITVAGLKNIRRNKGNKKLFYLAGLSSFWLLLIHNQFAITLRIQPIFIYLFLLSGLIINNNKQNSKNSFSVKIILIFFIPLLIWQMYINFQKINGLSYLQKSKDSFREGNKLQSSIILGEKAYEKIPQNSDLLYHLGYINVYAKKYQKANFYFDKLLEVSPYYPRANFWKGYIQSLQKNWKKSIIYYKREIKLNQSPHLYFNIAISYNYLNEKRRAMDYYLLYLKKIKEKLNKDVIQSKKSYISEEQRNINFALQNLYQENKNDPQKISDLEELQNYFRRYGLRINPKNQ
ncbi:MAG: O-antigen ligase family protein [Candidatus Cloacimonetes bacterium]|nr:O-antigen ligase family protein [Candidatus Cloacimonadota bacterium]